MMPRIAAIFQHGLTQLIPNLSGHVAVLGLLGRRPYCVALVNQNKYLIALFYGHQKHHTWGIPIRGVPDVRIRDWIKTIYPLAHIVPLGTAPC